VTVSGTSRPWELLLEVDRSRPRTLRAQVEDRLRCAIRDGRLPADLRLPSTRELAREMGVSRGVVVEAYSQLAAEGYLDMRQGAAPRVAAAGAAETPELVARPKTERVRYPFFPVHPDYAAFPREAWLASLRRAVQTAPDSDLGYGDPRGIEALRAALAAYLGRVRGVLATPERMQICSGYTQGQVLVCHALRRHGARRVATEDPGHHQHREIAERAGLDVAPIPVDERGLVVEELERADADAVILTPAHQYARGAVLAAERRTALLAWAERRDAVVIEDDYDAEYRYDRAPVGALQGLKPERVVYAGTASKTLAPTLRLGWLVLPSWLADAVAEEKDLADCGGPGLEQHAMADFLSRGDLDRHLRRTRLLYGRRRQALVEALHQTIPGVQIEGIEAGLHAVALLPGERDEAVVVERARARGVAVAGLNRFRCVPREGEAALMLGYGRMVESTLRAGVAELAKAIG
jgi:GntR family transcriptional regulator/MocR family aminotransferase